MLSTIFNFSPFTGICLKVLKFSSIYFYNNNIILLQLFNFSLFSLKTKDISLCSVPSPDKITTVSSSSYFSAESITELRFERENYLHHYTQAQQPSDKINNTLMKTLRCQLPVIT